jgi:hypothetical protein
MAPVPGRALLDRVIARVYEAGQRARSQEEHQLTTITLRLLSLLRRGELASLDLACFAVFGFSFAKFREKSLARQALMSWELSRCVPDFDPQEAARAHVVQASEERRSQETTRRVLPMPSRPKPSQPKPMRAVPRSRAANDAG